MKTNLPLRRLAGLLFGTALACQVQRASALAWIDEDNGDPLKFLSASSPTYSSTFNILLDGYNPLTMQVTSAVASFAFADDGSDEGEYVNIFIDGSALFTGLEVDGNHNNAPVSYDWHSAGLSGTLLAGLQDGVVNYSVTVTGGDTYLKRAKLVAEGTYRTSVPEGGATWAMLSLAMLGLAGTARWRHRLAV